MDTLQEIALLRSLADRVRMLDSQFGTKQCDPDAWRLALSEWDAACQRVLHSIGSQAALDVCLTLAEDLLPLLDLGSDYSRFRLFLRRLRNTPNLATKYLEPEPDGQRKPGVPNFSNALLELNFARSSLYHKGDWSKHCGECVGNILMAWWDYTWGTANPELWPFILANALGKQIQPTVKQSQAANYSQMTHTESITILYKKRIRVADLLESHAIS